VQTVDQYSSDKRPYKYSHLLLHGIVHQLNESLAEGFQAEAIAS